jgi:hypothetical protein
MVVLGGCHVKGFPVGELHSFVNALADWLHVSDKQNVIVSSVSVKRLHKTLESVGELGPQDLVLLQLGNFETLAPMMFGKPHNSNSVDEVAKSGAIGILASAGRFEQLRTAFVRSVGNGILFVIRELLRRPAFSASEFGGHLSDSRVHQSLSTAGVVVVIGALPTRVGVRNVYRRRANVQLSLFANRKNYVFVDYLYAVRRSPPSSITVDPIHLNVLGQSKLAEAVLKALMVSFSKEKTDFSNN